MKKRGYMAENKDESSVSKEVEAIKEVESQETSLQPTPELQLSKENKLKRFLKTRKGKVIATLLAIVVIIGVFLAIPASRYGILGNFIKKDVTVTVTDATTKKPVSQASVVVAGLEAKTDGDGKAVIGDVPVGEYTMKVSKNYYKGSEGAYVVPVLSTPGQPEVMLTATGRQVTILITNKITNAPLEDATIAVNDTAASTNANGQATLVLPADKETLQGKVEKSGYNTQDVTVQVTDQADANEFTLTPNGSVVYLSKASGTIDVMKANLDGTGTTAIVTGTGSEEDTGTQLVSTADWQYGALSARRDPSKTGQLYLVAAQTGKITTIEAGEPGSVYVQIIGWIGHSIVYTVNHNDYAAWKPKWQTLNLYNADTGKKTVIDETAGMGENYETMQRESINNVVIQQGQVLYSKTWGFGPAVAPSDDKKSILVAMRPGEAKRIIKEYAGREVAMTLNPLNPWITYARIAIGSELPKFYQYENSSLKEVQVNDTNTIFTQYPKYSFSPDGQKVFWSEPRDGKNALMVSDKDGNNKKVLDDQSDFAAFGWYGSDYLLLTKDRSELYIAPVAMTPDITPLKISSFHKADTVYPVVTYGYEEL